MVDERFTISHDACSVGFYEHVSLDICKPIEDQLNRRRLVARSNRAEVNVTSLKTIIERNSSLRIKFGWSFESAAQYTQIMEECMEEIGTRYSAIFGRMMSDDRCSWLGFSPFNIFDKAIYEDFRTDQLIAFNNELIEFQTTVVRFISEHKIFRQHSLLRNPDYRFDYYKIIRNNVDELSDAFQYYIDSVKDIVGLESIPRQHIEEHIGCHYLYHPDIFFELLEFYKLKGVIYE